MKLQVTGGGHGSFVVKDETSQAILTVNSVEGGYSAAHLIAEFVNGLAETPPEPAPAKKSLKPPKGDE